MPIRAGITLIATFLGVILLFAFQPPGTTAGGPPRHSSTATAASPANTTSSPPPDSATPSPTPSGQYKNGTFTGQDFPTNLATCRSK